jgi:hypothetical protein
MAVRPDLVGATEEPVEFAWTHDDTMLYAVAVGAGQYDPLAASPRSATATPARYARCTPPAVSPAANAPCSSRCEPSDPNQVKKDVLLLPRTCSSNQLSS